MLFSKAMARTQHRSFIPRIDRWGRFALKLRHVGVPLFAAAIAAGFLLSNQCPYVYGYSQIETARQNETQIAEEKVNETFGTQNVMALIVPKGDYASEKALLDRLETYDQVDYAMGLSNVEVMDGYMLTDSLTPRQFAEAPIWTTSWCAWSTPPTRRRGKNTAGSWAVSTTIRSR